MFLDEDNTSYSSFLREYYVNKIDLEVKEAAYVAFDNSVSVEEVFRSDKLYNELLRRIYSPLTIDDYLVLPSDDTLKALVSGVLRIIYESEAVEIREESYAKFLESMDFNSLIVEGKQKMMLSKLVLKDYYAKRLWGNEDSLPQSA